MDFDWRRYVDNKATFFAKYAAAGGAVGALIGEIVPDGPASFLELVLKVGIWAGIVGAGISMALTVSQDRYLKKKTWKADSWKGAIPGLISGLVGGAAAQATYTIVGPTELLRIICWGIFGALLGAFLSRKVPNLDRRKASVGGSIGGATGGLVFIMVSALFFSGLGRLVGCAVIGSCIGLMIAVTETFTREAWLEVEWSKNEIGTISLGSRPILIGSNRECDICVRDIPDMTAKIWTERGTVKIEDCTRHKMQELESGSVIKFGGMTATIRLA